MIIAIDFILVIPHELVSLILSLLDVSSIFSLSRVAKSYNKCKTISLCFCRHSISTVQLDAINEGHTNLFKWLVSHNEVPCNTTSDFMEETIIYNRLDILKYLHENGYSWCTYACDYAAENGHLEILKYLHENKCPWDEYAYHYAAANDHLDIGIVYPLHDDFFDITKVIMLRKLI